MRTIILIYPKIHFEENYPCSWIPFSILALGSTLPREQFEVLLYDENLTGREDIFQSISGKDILLVGLSIMTGGGQIKNALEIADRMRQEHPDAKIALGGPHANVLPEQTAACPSADYVISGMEQLAFAQLAACLADGKDLGSVPGLYYRRGSTVVRPVQQRALVQALTPYDFSLILPEAYIKYDATISDRTLNYIASQGCPYGCHFCYECSYKKKYFRMRSEFVRKDIAFYADTLHVDGIKFYDADFFVNQKHYGAIVSGLKEHGMNWAASIHPNDVLRAQKGTQNTLLDSIAGSRCTRLLMGMESGSNRVLRDVIHKNTRAEDYLLVAKTIADYGILGSYTFMVGFPGETTAEYDETFALIERLLEAGLPIETKVHIYLPYPGTPLFKEAVDRGFLPPKRLEDWSDYNYYKAMTPWTDAGLEVRASTYTHMIEKRGVAMHEGF